MSGEASIKADIVEVGRRLYARGLIGGNEGNISVRDGRFLYVTPPAVCKGFLAPDCIVKTDLEGRPVDGQRPSTEVLMHTAVYRRRPDVGAVVHAHPPTATGFAVAGIALDRPLTAEAVVTLGAVPVIPYGTPSTPELAENVGSAICEAQTLLLANHGALTVGTDLYAAYYKMETIEHFANISFIARMLGGERLLSREEVLRLQGLRGRYGIAAPAPICADPVAGSQADSADCQVVFAPASPSGERLVPERMAAVGADAEIRLTYRELTALIEDAVRNLK